MSDEVKNAFVCPNCHSDQVQSYELIYAQNVSSSTHTTTGVGISTGGGLGSGVATTSGTSVTALGEVVAPPSMQSTMTFKKGCLLYILLSIVLLPIMIIASATDSAFLYLLEMVIFFGAIYYFHRKHKKAKQWNKEVYPKLYEEWRHNYMCMKCGHSFKV